MFHEPSFVEIFLAARIETESHCAFVAPAVAEIVRRGRDCTAYFPSLTTYLSDNPLLGLEVIVGKWKHGPYLHGRGRKTAWCKVLNPNYSQRAGRHELFKSRAEPLKPTRRPAHAQ
jgi:hypothetical protein